jgi:hypothetical protein
MGIKLCNRCGEIKSEGEFYFNNKERTILRHVCKVCDNQLKNIRNKGNTQKRIILTQKRRLREICKLRGLTKTKNFDMIFGTDTKGFKEYLEGLFYGDISWDNYCEKKWEVDHKVPLKLINTYDDLDRLFHYTNLQPLLVDDHNKKSGLERGYVFKTLNELSNDVEVIVVPLIERGNDMSIQ